jgi:murein DD-endopeptidase MepM/ murein hydrolase activator NlpD
VDASDSVVALVVVEREGATGSADTLRAAAIVPKVQVATSNLSVAPQFSRPMDAETAARVARESARAREVGRAAHGTPRLWTTPFRRPRTSVITSRFGSGRVFNGEVTSRHLGVDFRGAVGEEVRAANRGIVALVDTFFLAGRLIYIDHGAGVTTAYLHLSEALVAEGDTVVRGQVIGRVGGTGRVTAPHLHWAARYGAINVNPLDLVERTTAGASAPSQADSPPRGEP